MSNHPRMTPKHGDAAKKGYPRPQKKWDERCSTCQNKREVYGLRGWERCPRCTEEVEDAPTRCPRCKGIHNGFRCPLLEIDQRESET